VRGGFRYSSAGACPRGAPLSRERRRAGHPTHQAAPGHRSAGRACPDRDRLSERVIVGNHDAAQGCWPGPGRRRARCRLGNQTRRPLLWRGRDTDGQRLAGGHAAAAHQDAGRAERRHLGPGAIPSAAQTVAAIRTRRLPGDGRVSHRLRTGLPADRDARRRARGRDQASADRGRRQRSRRPSRARGRQNMHGAARQRRKVGGRNPAGAGRPDRLGNGSGPRQLWDRAAQTPGAGQSGSQGRHAARLCGVGPRQALRARRSCRGNRLGAGQCGRPDRSGSGAPVRPVHQARCGRHRRLATTA
jgi:hypothetical protein